MASFYFPKQLTIHNIPIIVYPCVGLEKVFDRKTPHCLEDHIKNVYTHNKELATGQYHIIIIWNDGDDVMSDIWLFDKIESWVSGPLVDAKIFRNQSRELHMGISAGDGLIMLGREVELEERLRKSGKSLDRYITSQRAKLPEDIKPIEDFYQNLKPQF